jgi:hypothetical protein
MTNLETDLVLSGGFTSQYQLYPLLSDTLVAAFQFWFTFVYTILAHILILRLSITVFWSAFGTIYLLLTRLPLDRVISTLWPRCQTGISNSSVFESYSFDHWFACSIGYLVARLTCALSAPLAGWFSDRSSVQRVWWRNRGSLEFAVWSECTIS